MSSITHVGQVHELIQKFEMNQELNEKGLLSIAGTTSSCPSHRNELLACAGFRNMLLSEEFDIAQPMFTRHIYQDMTRYTTVDFCH